MFSLKHYSTSSDAENRRHRRVYSASHNLERRVLNGRSYVASFLPLSALSPAAPVISYWGIRRISVTWLPCDCLALRRKWIADVISDTPTKIVQTLNNVWLPNFGNCRTVLHRYQFCIMDHTFQRENLVRRLILVSWKRNKKGMWRENVQEKMAKRERRKKTVNI